MQLRDMINDKHTDAAGLLTRYEKYGLSRNLAEAIIGKRDTMDTQKIKSVIELFEIPEPKDTERITDFLSRLIPTRKILEEKKDILYLLERDELFPQTETQEQLLYIRVEEAMKLAVSKKDLEVEKLWVEIQKIYRFLAEVKKYNAKKLLAMGHPEGAKGEYIKALGYSNAMIDRFEGIAPYNSQLDIIDTYKEMAEKFHAIEFCEEGIKACEVLINEAEAKKRFRQVVEHGGHKKVAEDKKRALLALWKSLAVNSRGKEGAAMSSPYPSKNTGSSPINNPMQGKSKRVAISEESFYKYTFSPVMDNTVDITSVARNLARIKQELSRQGYGNIHAPNVIKGLRNLPGIDEKWLAVKVKIEHHAKGLFEYQIDKPDYESLFSVYQIFHPVDEIRWCIEDNILNLLTHRLDYHKSTFDQIKILNKLFFEYLNEAMVEELLPYVRIYRNGESLKDFEIDLGNLQTLTKNTFVTDNEGKEKAEYFEAQNKRLQELLFGLLKQKDKNPTVRINAVIVILRLVLIEEECQEAFKQLLSVYPDKGAIMQILRYFAREYPNKTFLTGDAKQRFLRNIIWAVNYLGIDNGKPKGSSAVEDAMDSLPDYAKSLVKVLLIQFNRIEPGIYVKFYHDDEHGLMHGSATVNKALGIAEREYARVEIGPDFYVIIASGLLHDADTRNRATHHIDSARLAVRILREMGWYKRRIALVAGAIYAHREVSAYEGLRKIASKTIEAQIVHDADTLLAVENFERITEYGNNKRLFYNPNLGIAQRLEYLSGRIPEGSNTVDSMSYLTHHLKPNNYFSLAGKKNPSSPVEKTSCSKEGNKAIDASIPMELRQILIQRGWNLSGKESFIKELVLFHKRFFYHHDFSVAENGHEYDKKKVILYSHVSALFVCRPNDAKVTELITTVCINCVGVSLISPLADGLAVFYLSYFFNKEYGYERDLEDAKKSDDIEKTLNEIKSVFTRLGAKDEDVRALIVGGYTYCGGLYATKASDFFKEQKIDRK